ncbi:MAG: SAF domain-containing protein [Propionibacteriaceae bacterium]|jgi:hypothetical protein|nr:SAF domain-containing protein [Propionibacteriaceae bacterium]
MKTNPLTLLVRFLTLHRRAVAALAAMLCVGALATVASGRSDTLVTVVTVAQRVAAGATVTAADVTQTGVPAQFVPEGALADPADAVGHLAAAALPRGAIVTADDLVAASGRTTVDGRLVLTVPLDQAELADLLHPGDRVALILSDYSGVTTVADDVVIVALTEPEGSLFGGGAASVLVDVPEATATLLAQATSVTFALR